MNFFTRLLRDKFDSELTPDTYIHLYHYLSDGTLEVVVKLHPTNFDRIYLVCSGKRLNFAFFKRTERGEYKTSSQSREIILPESFEKYLSPEDLYNIFETSHIPFNLYYGDSFEFITQDL